MRISDWSSDVCSSDLGWRRTGRRRRRCAAGRAADWRDDARGCVAAPADRAPPRCCRCDTSVAAASRDGCGRSEEHTSELQSLMRISYAVFCLKKKKKNYKPKTTIRRNKLRNNKLKNRHKKQRTL